MGTLIQAVRTVPAEVRKYLWYWNLVNINCYESYEEPVIYSDGLGLLWKTRSQECRLLIFLQCVFSVNKMDYTSVKLSAY